MIQNPLNECKIKHQHTEIQIIAHLMWISSSFMVMQTSREKLIFFFFKRKVVLLSQEEHTYFIYK